ncbi:MAG: hypothetical protein FWE49_01310 [Synergistaceae bacterium]|nr:hypothetical protein [Synergistaceae bacterium]
MESKVSKLNVLKFACAFTAFMIGSGFASGQEIMQFFTGFGNLGIIGAVISMILFAWSGAALMARGYEIKDTKELDHPFDHWFIFKEKGNDVLYSIGKCLSVFFEYFIPFFLFLVVVIMVSGAGATFNQYFELPVQTGCLIMALFVLISVLFGLKRLIDIIGILGSLTIVFTVIIGLYALMKNPGGLENNGSAIAEIPKAADVWWISGILYVAYNVTGSVPFLTSMGATANSREEAKWGAIIGSVLLMISGIMLLIGQLAYANEVGKLEVPNLFLANLVAPVFGFVFSLILLSEIYSSAAPMLWVTCSKLAKEGSVANRIIIVTLTVVVYFGGQLPFGMLIGTIYPYMGYIGAFFLVCILIRQLLNMKVKQLSK